MVRPAGQILTDAQLAGIRATVDQSLDAVATILERSGTDDGQGGEVVTWEPRLDEEDEAIPYPCRVLSRQTKNEQVAADQIQSITPYTIYLPWDCVVDATMRIQVGPVVYQIDGIRENMSQIAQVVADCSVVN